ncbi:MAG: hypothetical protein HYS80_01920 [Candidatus Aenigmarchaeota archaeon]|nr:hypothetical protein [Candidatus Aenigmarchaeota archaeon]
MFKRLFRQTDRQTDELMKKDGSNLVPSELEKDSLQLGFAAGYTGRSIHDINSTLNRIETMMPSKDWLLIELENQSKRLEEGDYSRLQVILEALGSLRSLSGQVSEPLKTQFLAKIDTVESKFEPSRRMKELIQLVKISGEVSFKNLAEKMNITGSALRTLIMMTLPRTNEIEKFDKGKKEKWLRYKRLDVQTDASNPENQSNEQTDTQI